MESNNPIGSREQEFTLKTQGVYIEITEGFNERMKGVLPSCQILRVPSLKQ
jgi:hypothetical protein